jgi:hypothetical protein
MEASAFTVASLSVAIQLHPSAAAGAAGAQRRGATSVAGDARSFTSARRCAASWTASDPIFRLAADVLAPG